jgi:NADPH:quinone reductase-like Zn-dependent oxidoreductase
MNLWKRRFSVTKEPEGYAFVETLELEASANELFNVVASGKVRINVNVRFALEDATDAHNALAARATSGVTILTI